MSSVMYLAQVNILIITVFKSFSLLKLVVLKALGVSEIRWIQYLGYKISAKYSFWQRQKRLHLEIAKQINCWQYWLAEFTFESIFNNWRSYIFEKKQEQPSFTFPQSKLLNCKSLMARYVKIILQLLQLFISSYCN